MRIVKDKRGSQYVEMSLFLSIVILLGGIILSNTGIPDVLVGVTQSALVRFSLVAVFGLVLGLVLGVNWGRRDPIEIVKAGDWDIAHRVETSGSLDVTVRLDMPGDPLGPWRIVGHCPRCGMPYFINGQLVLPEEQPYVWRTCRCFTSRKRRKMTYRRP